jgi:hypothetical protein
MSGSDHHGSNTADYLVVADPRSEGPILGKYGENNIAATVVDCFGRRYDYVGVATRRPSGRYDADALQPGEWIVEPGLVYRLNTTKQPRLSCRSARKEGHFSSAPWPLLSRLLRWCRTLIPERVRPHSDRLAHKARPRAPRSEESPSRRIGRTAQSRQKLHDK